MAAAPCGPAVQDGRSARRAGHGPSAPGCAFPAPAAEGGKIMACRRSPGWRFRSSG